MTSLHEKGVAVIELSLSSSSSFDIAASLQEQHQNGFDIARKAMDRVFADTSDDDDKQSIAAVMIPPDADSAHATGFHRAGGMSRYNAHREGFVFSDDKHPQQHRILSADKKWRRLQLGRRGGIIVICH